MYDDSTVGDYDGGDDTLVGIWNNSPAPVTAITVTGPGSFLSEFDSDGLCTYTSCTWPAATGYEGPTNTFTTNSSLPDSAEVDFTGGLNPGATTYFSLEGTLTAATLTGRQGPLAGLNYVAMGDSYSSGEGNSPYIAGTDVRGMDECHRSISNAYPDLIAADLANGINSSTFPSPGFVACSGATRSDLWSGNVGNNEPSQLDAVTSSTNLVTIGLGGDDVGFHDVLDRCITGAALLIQVHGNANCANSPVTPPSGSKETLNTYENGLIGDLGSDELCQTPQGFQVCNPSLTTIYETIASQAAPDVKIRVLLYPHLFTNLPPNSGCQLYSDSSAGIFVNISKANILWLNQGVDKLDHEISTQVGLAAADGIDIQTVDPRSDFGDDAAGASPGGHGVCTKRPWIAGLIKGLGLSIESGSFHPTVPGQQVFADEIAPTLR